MSTAELHAHDVASGTVQTVQANGRVYIVTPDPERIGRWLTIWTVATLAEAATWITGYNAGARR